MVVLSFPSYIYSVTAGSGTGEEPSWGKCPLPDSDPVIIFVGLGIIRLLDFGRIRFLCLSWAHEQCTGATQMPVYEVSPPQGQTRRRSRQRCLAIRSPVVRRANAVCNAIRYAEHYSRSHDAVIHVYDEAGNVTQNARAQGRFQGGLTITFEISSEESFRIPTRYLCSRPTAFCTSASKRGSPRRGSSFGSVLIMVMVRLS